MRHIASYGESLSSSTCLLKRKAIWFVTSILVPLFALLSLMASWALNGSYSAYFRRRLSLASGTASPVAPRLYSRLQVSYRRPCFAANCRSVTLHPARTSSFQSDASVCRWSNVRYVPGTCCVIYFLTASFLVAWCFCLAAFIIPQIATPLFVFRATPPWGRAFLRFSLRFRSLSFFFRTSFLHLDSLPFQFDSLDCTTSGFDGRRTD